jgi:hypothetical protein
MDTCSSQRKCDAEKLARLMKGNKHSLLLNMNLENGI